MNPLNIKSLISRYRDMLAPVSSSLSQLPQQFQALGQLVQQNNAPTPQFGGGAYKALQKAVPFQQSRFTQQAVRPYAESVYSNILTKGIGNVAQGLSEGRPLQATEGVGRMGLGALSLYGLGKLSPMTLGVTGGLGAGIGALGGDPLGGFYSGLSRAPSIAGIGALSNPIQTALSGGAGSLLSNPLAARGLQGAVSAGLSVPEGYLMNKASGIEDYGKGDLAFDLGAGFLAGALQRPLSQADMTQLRQGLKTALGSEGSIRLPDPFAKGVDLPPAKPENTLINNRAVHPREGVYQNPAKLGSESLIEQAGGWKPGVREQFDLALFNKDREAVKRLLPDVPVEYRNKFSKEIQAVVGDKGFIESIKDDFNKTIKSESGNIDLDAPIGADDAGIRGTTTDGLKDISGFYGGFRDVYRNFKAVYGSKFPEVKKAVLDPFDASKGKFVDELKNWEKQLDDNVVRKFDIKKGSKESAAVQWWGEGSKGDEQYQQLVKRFGQKKADNIVEADKWFRSSYDRLLEQVNAARKQIYPNDATKIIPKRTDYYRHFREMAEGFEGLRNIFDTPANISSSLSGVSEYTKPKSKWLSFAQQRLGNQTDVDAVGGFIDYVRAAEYAKNIDPQIAKFRGLADDLRAKTAEGTPDAGKLNNFIEFINDWTNDLTGKTNPLDRAAQKWIPGGRTTFRALNWANSRVKANVILGNVSSTIAQIFNVPQGIASAGPINATRGIGRSLASMFNPNNPMKQSVFIKERYNNAFDKFDTGMLNNTKKFAAWMTSVLDEVGTKYIWNSHYEKAIRENIPNPAKYADDITRNLVAGRGIGEVPIAQKARVFQMVAPFQLEVGNLWYVLKDFVDERRFGAIATLFVMNYIFNRTAEQIRGSGVSFDPIQATFDALGELDEEQGGLKAGGRLAGEVLSNVPLGQSVAALYPEYGARVGDTELPTREELFGKADPTRFGGSGLLATQTITDPLFKLLPPFGGNQIKKTIQGLGAYGQGFSETASGRVRFPIDQNPMNAAKSALFGQYATSDAREYFNEDRQPLGEKQSEIFKQVGEDERRKYYDMTINKREMERQKEEMKERLMRGDTGGLIPTAGADENMSYAGRQRLQLQEEMARAEVEIDGQTRIVGDKAFLLKDNKVTEVNLKKLAQQRTDAAYQLEAQRLTAAKRTGDLARLNEAYMNMLIQRQKTLDPNFEGDEILTLQNKIEDIQAKLSKIRKTGIKGRKLKQVKLKVPKARRPKPVKIKKPKTYSMKFTKVGKVKRIA